MVDKERLLLRLAMRQIAPTRRDKAVAKQRPPSHLGRRRVVAVTRLPALLHAVVVALRHAST